MNQQKVLRWGILGAARITERMMPAINQASNAQLIAVASRRPKAAALAIGRYIPNVPHIIAYDNLDELLNNPDIDAVYIPLANDEHSRWVLRAITAGKHVLCEKPMALSVSEIAQIEQAAKKQGVIVMEGFMYRFHPQHQRVLSLISSGLIGDIGSVRSNFSFMMSPARQYRLEKSIEQGGGAMWDIGCYAIHSLRLFFDRDPLSVVAMANYTQHGVDTGASGIFDFGHGQFAHFDFSFDRARRCEYEIIGTKGGIKCHTVWQLPGDRPVISWWQEGGPVEEEYLSPDNHFTLEIEHFSHCVLDNKTPRLSLADAKSNCTAILAALQAASQGKRIELASIR